MARGTGTGRGMVDTENEVLIEGDEGRQMEMAEVADELPVCLKREM